MLFNALFYLFSGASNLRSLQATYPKCAEYIDILVYIIHAKFKSERTKDNGYTGCTKMEKSIKTIGRRISAVCISFLYYSSMSKLLPPIGRDTGNNLFVQNANQLLYFQSNSAINFHFSVFYEFQQPK